MDTMEVKWGGMDLDQWRALANTAMNLRFLSLKQFNVRSNEAPSSLSLACILVYFVITVYNVTFKLPQELHFLLGNHIPLTLLFNVAARM
jgi:hypothetical protein